MTNELLTAHWLNDSCPGGHLSELPIGQIHRKACDRPFHLECGHCWCQHDYREEPCDD